jgi:uncharacterized protein (DUF58 family)
VTRAATPKLAAYAVLAAVGLFGALAFARPEPAILAAPFAVMLVIGVAIASEPDVRIDVELDRERVLEGDEVVVALELYARESASRLELLVDLPARLELIGGRNPIAIRLATDEERRVELRLRCTRWGALSIGDVHVRITDPGGLFTWTWSVEHRAALRVYPRPEALRELVRPIETQVFAGNRVARQ